MTDILYRLELLGGLELKGPTELSGRVVQRRQLALLALLAAHESPLSRDKVIGFLWPETTAERARHQLSDALYVVRKELDEAAVVVTGDTVRLDPAVVGSDLADFRSALASESYEEALAHYGGPFLDGFFPEGSEAFERWMADERESLERQAARAAWTLVDRAEEAGEVHEAVRWARRALEIVPEDERGVRRLIGLQDSIGDRAGAVRTYEEFAARLEAELEVPPSEETQALVAAIRERPVADRESEATGVAHERADTPPGPVDTVEGSDASPAAPRPERSPHRAVWVGAALGIVLLTGWLFFPRSEGGSSATTGDGPAIIAVLPFEVRGEGLEVWHEGMVDIVSTNIDPFSEVRAVPSRTVLARWREAGDDGPADLAGTLQVARGTEARYAVTGSVVGTERGLRVRGELYDVQTGARLGATRVEGPADSIFSLVDRLSVELLAPLLATGAEGRDRWPRLTRVTTSSPSALRSFLNGERHFRAGRYQQAIEEYTRAVDEDSTFAFAYYRLSDANGWTAAGIDGPRYARLALRYADRLPERQARLIRAVGLWYFKGRPAEAIEILHEAVRQHPDDAEAWYKLGEAHFHTGSQLLLPRRALGMFERSIALDPTFFPAYEHIVDAAFTYTPDSARAAELLQRQSAAGEIPFRDRVGFALAFGDEEARERAMADLEELSSFDLAVIGDWALSHPRFIPIRKRILRKALERADPNWEPHHRLRFFWTLLGSGRVDEAVRFSRDDAFDELRANTLYEARGRGYPIPEEALERALAEAPASVADPTEALVIFERGAYAAETGDRAAHTRAKQELRALIPLVQPDRAPDTLRLRGLVEALDGYWTWKRGDRERALVQLRAAQRRSIGGGDFNKGILPRNRTIRRWLAELSLERKEPREALRYYESIRGVIMQDPMIFFHMARLHDQLGDPEEALADYRVVADAWGGDIDPELRPLAVTVRKEVERLSNADRAGLRP